MMQLHHVELYSGVGGMRLAVQTALPPHVQYVCHKAFDVNTNANRVYEHNFNHAPSVLSLEHCTAADLYAKQQQQRQQRQQQQQRPTLLQPQQHVEGVGVGRPSPLLWTLSPPCQPYTTTANSKQADAQDTRAGSLAHLLQLMPQLQQLPSHILLENVPSFHASHSHQQVRAVLQQLGYHTVDVVLCPSQLGVPHLRRRHYTLAKRRQWQHSHQQHQQPPAHQQNHSSSSSSASTACSSAHAFSEATTAQLQQLAHGQPAVPVTAAAHQPRALRTYLQLDWSQASQPLRQSDAALQQQVARYALPLARVGRYFRVLDLVAPGSSRHSNCFTKGYGKSILGTGSYLLEDAAAQLLARQDNRGRWHLERDPYCSSSSSSSSSSSLLGAARQAAESSQPCASAEQHSMLQVGAGDMALDPAQQPPAGQGSSQVDEADVPPLLRVRCFTPREVAALQGFPASFSFPEAISDRQAYALLGNSVSIDAVSYLVGLLLEDVIGGT